MKIKGRILSLRSQSFLGEYEQFCVDHCGIVKASVVRNRLYLRRFLAWLERKEKKVEDLDAELVQSYLASVLWRKSRTVKKSILYTVRVFLRFLHLKGYLQRPLDTAVPKIAIYKHSGVPHFLRKDEIDRLLRAPDRSTESGRRDFAMLLLMARYGARLLSVKQLKVADIDWRGKCILFQSLKSGKDVTVPLLPDVAKAILDYVRKDRGNDPTPELFLTVRARGTGGSQHARHAMSYCNHLSQFKGYYAKAQIESPRKGCHILRHSFATNLLADRVPITNISELLGHTVLDTTQIYTKVQIEDLRSIAPAWPKPFVLDEKEAA